MEATSVFVFSGVGAALITLVELSYRHQRHPLGDRRSKALGWWLLLALTDASIALGITFGLTEFDVVQLSPNASLPDWGKGLAIGIIGPLALRSPIRTKEIRSEDAPIGITYIYDIVRLYILFAVDERMVRLRRADVTNMRTRWMNEGLSPIEVADYLRRHIEEHPQLQQHSKEEANESVRQCLTLPAEEQQMDALIKLLRANRFSSVRDHFSVQIEASAKGGAATDAGG